MGHRNRNRPKALYNCTFPKRNYPGTACGTKEWEQRNSHRPQPPPEPRPTQISQRVQQETGNKKQAAKLVSCNAALSRTNKRESDATHLNETTETSAGQPTEYRVFRSRVVGALPNNALQLTSLGE